jgi:hypothetical protein
MTGGTNISHPGRTFPSWTSGFYAADTFFNPNGELVLAWKPIPEFTATLGLGVGQNFIARSPPASSNTDIRSISAILRGILSDHRHRARPLFGSGTT